MSKVSTNVVVLTGGFGSDPEYKTLASGTTVANFSIAVNEVRNGEEITNWIDVTAFGKLADFVGKYLSKGSRVAVTGRLQQRSFERQDGSTASKVRVVAERIESLSKANSSNDSGPQEPSFDETDMPF